MIPNSLVDPLFQRSPRLWFQKWMLAGSVIALTALISPAQAQTIGNPDTEDEAPLQLFPIVPEEEPELEAPAEPDPSQIITTTPSGIAVEKLDRLDLNTVGLLDRSNGGFGVDMWLGSTRPDIDRLVKHLPTQYSSPSLRKLARTLLLSTAELPGAETDQPTENLLKIRLEKLTAMGFLEDALTLSKAAGGQTANDPEMVRLLLRAQFLAGDLGTACDFIRQQQENLGEAYWQKRLVLCQLLDGNITAAGFGATLLRDDGEDDPLFFNLVRRITDKIQEPLPEVTAIDELHLAMMWLSQTAIPETILSSAEPAVLKAISESPHTDIDIRLRAAEIAANMGTISPDILAEIYKSVAFSSEELLRPLSLAEESYGPKSRALLYQAASIETVPDTKALLIRKSLELSRRAQLYPITVAVHTDQILQMPVSGDLWEFANEAARALYAIGRSKPAEAWLSHLEIEAQRNPEAMASLQAMWALSRLASDSYDPETDDENRMKWVEQTVQNSQDQSEFEAMRRIEMAYELIEAVDNTPVSPLAWTQMLDLPRNRYTSMPNPALTRLMAIASENGRRAETVAWTLWLLSETGPALADPATLKSAIASLRKVGLDQEAFEIAAEAALNVGL